MKTSVPVTGVWLLNDGGKVIVRVERAGKWVEVIRETMDGGPFSHIVEGGYIREVTDNG